MKSTAISVRALVQELEVGVLPLLPVRPRSRCRLARRAACRQTPPTCRCFPFPAISGANRPAVAASPARRGAPQRAGAEEIAISTPPPAPTKRGILAASGALAKCSSIACARRAVRRTPRRRWLNHHDQADRGPQRIAPADQSQKRKRFSATGAPNVLRLPVRRHRHEVPPVSLLRSLARNHSPARRAFMIVSCVVNVFDGDEQGRRWSSSPARGQDRRHRRYYEVHREPRMNVAIKFTSETICRPEIRPPMPMFTTSVILLPDASAPLAARTPAR